MTQLYSALLLNILRRQLDSSIASLSELPSCHQLSLLSLLHSKMFPMKHLV